MRFQYDVAALQRVIQPWCLAFALGFLHLGLLQGVDSVIGQGFLLAHLGAVLVWQPLVSGARRLRLREMLLGAAGVTAVAWGLSWGLLLLWILLLAGMLGGRVFLHGRARDRLPYWLALSYLVLAMMCLVLPQMLPGHNPQPILGTLINMLLLPVMLGVLIGGRLQQDEARSAVPLDFVGSLVIVLVLAGVMLGALALMFVDGMDYLQAMLQSIAVMAGGLLLLAWVWNPRRGFEGLGLILSRQLLSGGQLFERWLESVADAALQGSSPVELVAMAAQRMGAWPGVRKLRWHLVEPIAVSGDEVPVDDATELHWQVFEHGALRMELGTRQPLGAAALWQFDLMSRVLAEFHRAAMQAQRLQALSYLRAVHETGARVTHEVKNLLQSLDTLCYAVADVDVAGDAARVAARDALIRRQLPLISQRLHEALVRIRTPDAAPMQPVQALHWWAALRERHAREGVSFESTIPLANMARLKLPAGLFDVVADNVLRNALGKARLADAAPLQIVCSLLEEDGACAMRVTDDGAALDAVRAQNLFHSPLPSDTGFGVGLYQCAQLATTAGFQLRLVDNKHGAVSFELRPVPKA